jgi:hypothetical protein
LDYRLGIFKNVTLKSFQEQTDKDFIVFLLHSVDLPQKYKNIFQNLEENNHFLHNIYLRISETADNCEALKEQAKEFVNFDDLFLSFRIDNDDALPCDYISKIKNYLKPECAGHVISVPQIQLIQKVNRKTYIMKGKFHHSTSIGLAYVSNNDNKIILQLGAHHKLYQEYPVIMLPGKGGLQTINGRNVANRMPFIGRVYKFTDDTLKTFLKNNNYPDIDFNCLHILKRYHFVTMVRVLLQKIKNLNK